MGRFYDGLKDSHDDTEGDYYVNIGLKNNGLVSDHAFVMLGYICQLEETLPEYALNKAHKIELSRRQNSMFPQFREELRYVFYATEGQIKRNKPTGDDTKTIKAIHNYLNKPYGSYKIMYLLEPAREYYGMLTGKGIVPIVLGYGVESSMKKWVKS